MSAHDVKRFESMKLLAREAFTEPDAVHSKETFTAKLYTAEQDDEMDAAAIIEYPSHEAEKPTHLKSRSTMAWELDDMPTAPPTTLMEAASHSVVKPLGHRADIVSSGGDQSHTRAQSSQISPKEHGVVPTRVQLAFPTFELEKNIKWRKITKTGLFQCSRRARNYFHHYKRKTA